MKKILITGATGFIGSSLSNKTLYRKIAVAAVDNFSVSNRMAVMHSMHFWGRNVNKLTILPKFPEFQTRSIKDMQKIGMPYA